MEPGIFLALTVYFLLPLSLILFLLLTNPALQQTLHYSTWLSHQHPLFKVYQNLLIPRPHSNTIFFTILSWIQPHSSIRPECPQAHGLCFPDEAQHHITHFVSQLRTVIEGRGCISPNIHSPPVAETVSTHQIFQVFYIFQPLLHNSEVI